MGVGVWVGAGVQVELGGSVALGGAVEVGEDVGTIVSVVSWLAVYVSVGLGRAAGRSESWLRAFQIARPQAQAGDD